MSLQLRSRRPDRPPVPEVPPEIIGPCVYGYLITDEHRNHFQSLYPDTRESQISTLASLVSYASVIISNIHMADAVPVYDHQGGKAVCLALIDYQDRGYPIDQRYSDKFITDIKRVLGIERMPDNPDGPDIPGSPDIPGNPDIPGSPDIPVSPVSPKWYSCRFKQIGDQPT